MTKLAARGAGGTQAHTATHRCVPVKTEWLCMKPEDLSRQKSSRAGIERNQSRSKSATQNVAAAQIVGQTKIANGIGFDGGRLSLPAKSQSRLSGHSGRSDCVHERCVLWLAGQYSHTSTSRVRQAQAQAPGLLPDQVFSDRMTALEELEKRVKSPL